MDNKNTEKSYNYINEILKGIIFLHGSDKEKEGISDDGEQKDPISIQILKLTPDKPSFIINANNVKTKRLESIPEENTEQSLFFFDLFDLVQKKCLLQFGLQNITFKDLALNNVQKAILVVNKKGLIVNIVTNRGANNIFITNLINNKLENSIQNIPSNKILQKKILNKPSPFDFQ